MANKEKIRQILNEGVSDRSNQSNDFLGALEQAVRDQNGQVLMERINQIDNRTKMI